MKDTNKIHSNKFHCRYWSPALWADKWGRKRRQKTLGEHSDVYMIQSRTLAQKSRPPRSWRAALSVLFCPAVPLPPKTLAEEEAVKRRLFRTKNLHGGLLGFEPRTKDWGAYLRYQGEQGPPHWHATPPTLNLPLPFCRPPSPI